MWKQLKCDIMHLARCIKNWCGLYGT